MAGRPSKYKAKYCQELIKHFDVPAYVSVPKMNPKTGNEYEELVPSMLPTFESFAHSLGVTHATIINWKHEYPEFAAAYERAKGLQKDILVQNGLQRLYDSRFAMFMAVNNTDLVSEKVVKHKVTLDEDADGVASGLTDEELAAIAAGKA